MSIVDAERGTVDGSDSLAVRLERERMTPVGKEITRLLARFRDEVRHRPHVAERNGKRFPVYPSTTELLRLLLRLAHEAGMPIPRRRSDGPSNPILSVPHEDLLATGGEETRKNILAGYEASDEIVAIPEQAFLGTSRTKTCIGDKLGEEIFGHAFRHAGIRSPYLIPLKPSEGGEMEKESVEEFYGYVGRKMLHWLLKQHDCVTVLFRKGEVTPPTGALQAELEELRDEYRWAIFGGKKGIQQKIDNTEARMRGYAAAQQFDPERVPPQKFKEFYALPTEKAEELFLQGEPQYDKL